MKDPQTASDQRELEGTESLAEVVELVGGLPGGYTLSHPIQAEVWIENGEYVADVAELNLHAFGTTRAEALTNVCSRIVEQRTRLLTLRRRLSPLMEHEAARLEALVLPCDA